MFAADDSASQELRSDRLSLRPPRRTDAVALQAAIAETLPELIRWLPWARPGHSLADTRRYLRGARLAWSRRSACEFLVATLPEQQIVGITSLHRIDWVRRCAGIGYWVRRDLQGRGYASEAARIAIDHAFRVLGLHRLEAHVALDNEPSHRVIAALGFRREGVARDAEYVDGAWLDHVQYSLLRSDSPVTERAS